MSISRDDRKFSAELQSQGSSGVGNGRKRKTDSNPLATIGLNNNLHAGRKNAPKPYMSSLPPVRSSYTSTTTARNIPPRAAGRTAKKPRIASPPAAGGDRSISASSGVSSDIEVMQPQHTVSKPKNLFPTRARSSEAGPGPSSEANRATLVPYATPGDHSRAVVEELTETNDSDGEDPMGLQAPHHEVDQLLRIKHPAPSWVNPVPDLWAPRDPEVNLTHYKIGPASSSTSKLPSAILARQKHRKMSSADFSYRSQARSISGAVSSVAGTTADSAITIDDSVYTLEGQTNSADTSMDPLTNDPIEDSDSCSRPSLSLRRPLSRQTAWTGRPPIPEGTVSKRTSQYEAISSTGVKPPSAVVTPIPIPGQQPRPGVAQKMKPKDTSRVTPSSRQTTGPTPVPPKQSTSRASKGKSRQERTGSRLPERLLPLKSWYFGEEAHHSTADNDDPGFWIKWTDFMITLCTAERLRGTSPFPSGTVLHFLAKDVDQAEISSNDEVEPCVVTMTLTSESMPSYREQFFPANDRLVLEFDLTSDDWRGHEFGKFSRTLEWALRKRSKELTKLRPPAPKSILDGARQMVRSCARSSLAGRAPSSVASSKDDASRSETSSITTARRRQPRPISKPATAYADIDQEDEVVAVSSEEMAVARRSKRQARAAAVTSINDTEFLFSYPPVNITRGELNRLEPDEFLNDTLIEFGLKMWTNDLAEQDPPLADDIWVFNSFFYKKLSGKKLEEGYQSVKKWTAKIDIFKKRFIVVPINENLHWYLAVIYRPELALNPTKSPIQATATRWSARKSTGAPPTPAGPVSPSETEAAEQNEVDHELLVSDSEPEQARPPDDDGCFSPTASTPPSSESACDEDGDTNMGAPIDADMDPETTFEQPPDFMDVDRVEEVDELDPENSDEEIPMIAPRTKNDDRQGQSVNNDASKPAPTPLDLAEMGASLADASSTKSDDDRANVIDLTRNDDHPMKQPITYIFVMDSLGGTHPKAVAALKFWLKLEALNKKGVEIGDIAGRNVPVPYQPNHVDCGVYLLHFADVFVRKVNEIQQRTETRGALKDAAVRDQVFEGQQLKKKRAALKERTVRLMEEWRLSHPLDLTKPPTASVAKANSQPPVGENGMVQADAKSIARDKAVRKPPIVQPSGPPRPPPWLSESSTTQKDKVVEASLRLKSETRADEDEPGPLDERHDVGDVNEPEPTHSGASPAAADTGSDEEIEFLSMKVAEPARGRGRGQRKPGTAALRPRDGPRAR